MSKKKPVRFIIEREYSGKQDMIKVFEAVLETEVRKKLAAQTKKKEVA